jgi:hypothetical protein
MDSTMNPKGEHQKDMELGYTPWFTALGGRGVCWSSEMGIKKSDKQINYSHKPTQTKQAIG